MLKPIVLNPGMAYTTKPEGSVLKLTQAQKARRRGAGLCRFGGIGRMTVTKTKNNSNPRGLCKIQGFWGAVGGQFYETVMILWIARVDRLHRRTHHLQRPDHRRRSMPVVTLDKADLFACDLGLLGRGAASRYQ